MRDRIDVLARRLWVQEALLGRLTDQWLRLTLVCPKEIKIDPADPTNIAHVAFQVSADEAVCWLDMHERGPWELGGTRMWRWRLMQCLERTLEAVGRGGVGSGPGKGLWGIALKLDRAGRVRLLC